MIAAAAVFLTLLASRAAGFWSYVLRAPGVLDARSLKLLIGFGVWPGLLAAGLWVAALGLGRRALRALGAPPRDALDALAAAALGLGLLGQAVFLLGWTAGLRPMILGAAALAAAALAAGELRRPALRRPRLNAFSGAAAGLLAFAALDALLEALAPPVAWDVRAYHLAIPELGLRAGGWTPLPWLLHSHWPHLMEALYALPLAAGRDGAAALTHAGAAALLVAGVFIAARRSAGYAAAWTAALVLAAQPAFLSEAGTAHSDAAAALFAFAAAHALARWDEDGSRSWLAAAGLLAGLAAASKLTLLALPLGWALWLAARRRRARAAGLFLALGLLMLVPWLFQTWRETGDPLWPFLARRLGDAAGGALAARNAFSNRWVFPPPAAMLTLDGPGYLLLPLAGLWALGRGRAKASKEELWLWAAAPLLIAVVFRQHAAWRYLMPLWAAFALAAGRAAAAAFEKKGPRAAAAAALVAAAAFPIAAASPNNALFAVLAPRPSAAPDADRRGYWADRALEGLPGFYQDARLLLPAGAKVLLWREVRGYGAGFDYQWGDPMNQDLLEYRSIRDPDALYTRLKFLGVTHVLENSALDLYQEDPGYYDRRTLALMTECLRRRGHVALARGGFALHELL
jgi:hypothetical protein